MQATSMSKRRKRALTREMDARDRIWCHWTAVSTPRFGQPIDEYLKLLKLSRRRKRRRHRAGDDVIRLAACALIVVAWVTILGAGVATCQPRAETTKSEYSSGSPVILKTEQNQLFRGLRDRSPRPANRNAPSRDVISFLGIRYASAPIRRLRFMPPTPFTYAPGQVHEARAFGPICPQRLPVAFNAQQTSQLLATNLGGGGGNSTRDLQLSLMADLLPNGDAKPLERRLRSLLELPQSEDCLSLNIFVPHEAVRDRLLAEPPEVSIARAETGQRQAAASNHDELRPVLVVIHADSFDYAAGATISGARHFARASNLLVVTFNFRLNLLGFPPTQTTSESMGSRARATRNNLGLLDQVALLHWLRSNVRSFGGSPQSVTLLGLKRGAVFVNLLMMSPLAKGLFQRAILEDGTALQANSNANNQQHVHLQQQQVAWQHARLLALAANCQGSSGGESRETSAASDWSPAGNQAALECLRTSPIEALVQPIPFGLLDASASVSANELVLAKRWLRPLATFLKRDGPAASKRALGELQLRLAAATAAESTSAAAVQISAGQLDELIVHLITTKRNGSFEDVELMNELLGAIYLPSNETLATPPFAPQLEGALVGDSLQQHWDLRTPPLANEERLQFGQHDLLLGSSELLLQKSKQQQQETTSDESSLLLQPMERFGKQTRRHRGLTDEQALQQVSLFVRTHFRFHQQEIANSIVSNYFLNGGQLALASQPALPEEDVQHQKQQDEALRGQLSEESLARQRKQLQLLRSLEGAYRDALISVPLIRTALLHSARQLEMLGELFAHKLAADLLLQMNESLPLEVASEQLQATNSSLEQLDLGARFQKFARDLYEQPRAWPLELASKYKNQTSNAHSRSPRATYLYQVAGVDFLLAKLQVALDKLNGASSLNKTASLQKNLRENLLKKVLVNRSELAHEFGLGCSLLQDEDSADLVDAKATLDEESDFLANGFRTLACRSLSTKVIGNFATSGNVNNKLEPEVADKTTTTTFAELGAAMEQFEAECGAQSVRAPTRDQTNNIDLDHDSVQLEGVIVISEQGGNETTLGSGARSDEQLRASCRKQLDLLTLEYLERVLSEDWENSSKTQYWHVFNLFSQQIITFDGRDGSSRESLAAKPATARQDRDRFERKIAFWANFIPTLDCSRTQPLSASSLSLSQASNATLLNMNLNFNCQQPGGGSAGDGGAPRTAGAHLHSIGVRVKLALSEFLSFLNKQRALLARGPNHHTPRMVGANESLGQGLADELSAIAPTNRQLNSSLGSWLTVDSQQELTPAAGANGSLLALLFGASSSLNANSSQVTLMSLWPFGGLLLIGSMLLTSGGFVLLARRRRRQKQQATAARERKKSAAQEQEYEQQPINSNLCDLVPHSQVEVSLGAQEQQQNCHLHEQHAQIGLNHPADLAANYSQQRRDSMPQQILMPILAAPHNFVQLNQTGSAAHSDSCNLLLHENPNCSMGHGIMQQALSSSSETTTATTTNRAHSSVSLVSSSTNNTTTTIANQPANSQSNTVKKRVKISDPKRRTEAPIQATNAGFLATDDYLNPVPTDYRATSSSPLYLNSDSLLASMDLQLHQLQNQNQQQGPLASQFCPIHRSSSSNYLIANGATASRHVN